MKEAVELMHKKSLMIYGQNFSIRVTIMMTSERTLNRFLRSCMSIGESRVLLFVNLVLTLVRLVAQPRKVNQMQSAWSSWLNQSVHQVQDIVKDLLVLRVLTF